MKFDTNTANLVAAIAASLAAMAAFISVIVSVLVLRKTTKQTDILTEQFKIVDLARKEAARPRLTVEISKYRPPDSGQMRSDIRFTLRNAGHIGIRVVRIQTQSGQSPNQDVICSVEIHPGYPEEVVANILPPAPCNPPVLKAWFEIATPDGAHRQLDAEWELRTGQFALLKSELAIA